MLAVILLSFAMPSSFHKHSATKSSADLPPWRSTWQAIPRPFFHLFVSPIHHHALIGQRPPGSTRARLVVSEIACACACLGLPDDAVDGRGVRAARQASRWLIAIRRAGCVEKSKRQIGNSDCNPVPFSLVTSSRRAATRCKHNHPSLLLPSSYTPTKHATTLICPAPSKHHS